MKVAYLVVLAVPLCSICSCSDQGEFLAASADGGLSSSWTEAVTPAPLELPPGTELLPAPSEAPPTDPEEVEQAAETASSESFNVVLELAKPPASAPSADAAPPDVSLTSNAGTGLLVVSTEQPGDKGDEVVWVRKDVNGDGTQEELQVVVDDEEETTYVAFSLPGPCDDGSAGLTEFIIADNGFDRRMLATSTCPGARGAVVTCSLDGNGNPTDCATCEEEGDTFLCSPVAKTAPPTNPKQPPTAPTGFEPTPKGPPSATPPPASSGTAVLLPGSVRDAGVPVPTSPQPSPSMAPIGLSASTDPDAGSAE